MWCHVVTWCSVYVHVCACVYACHMVQCACVCVCVRISHGTVCMRQVVQKYDTNASGSLEWAEFMRMVCEVLPCEQPCWPPCKSTIAPQRGVPVRA